MAFTSAYQNVDATRAGQAGPRQVFVHDRLTGGTALVSRTPAGEPGDAESGGRQSALSADGRYVAFESEATDLVGPVLTSGQTDGPDLVRAARGVGNQVVLSFDEPAWQTCPGTGPCTLAMAASRSITATFGPAKARLSVDRAGPGGGAVTSEPGGIACGSTCVFDFDTDSTVTLTASAASGSTFSGWSGACQGTESCSVVMSEARFVTASFVLAPVSLTVLRTGTGSGTVTSAPDGIACGDKCTFAFPAGSEVVLNATPDSGSGFFGWSGGGCPAEANTCKVRMTAPLEVSAQFDTVVALTVTVNIGGNRVTSVPGGIDCSTVRSSTSEVPHDGCSAMFQKGDTREVALFASPAAGYYFSGWSGDCIGASGCEVTMSAARSVTATFTGIINVAPPDPAVRAAAAPADSVPTSKLTVATAGTATGRVVSDVGGIDCRSTCSAEFATGTDVTLTAQPDPGSRFNGWSGYRVVTWDGRRDVTTTCSLVSGDGTTTHIVSCPALGIYGPEAWWASVESGALDDTSGVGGAPNPLQQEYIQRQTPSQICPLITPHLDRVALDVGGTDSLGSNADVITYTFFQTSTCPSPVSLLDLRGFTAYREDAGIVFPLEAIVKGNVVVAAYPDGSLATATGTSVHAGTVEERDPDPGEEPRRNNSTEIDLVNVGGGGNAGMEIFVFDRDADEDGTYDEPEPGATRTTRMSVGLLGARPNGLSSAPSISADGRYVAFQSGAENLLGPKGSPTEDTNGLLDVFVHNRDADGDGVFDESGSAESTVRASVADDGSQSVSGPTLPRGNSFEPSISGTGRFVAFTSGAVNLVGAGNGGPDTNATDDVFVRDRDADGDGVFDEGDAGATTTVRVSVRADGTQLLESLEPAISADGRIVAFTNNVARGKFDVLVHDRDADADAVFDETEPGARSTTVASVGPSGAPGDGDSYQPAISDDGRHVSFFSLAEDLVADGRPAPGRDVFVRDRLRGVTSVLSVATSGARGDDDSDSSSSLSGDGRYVAFASDASNLVPGDTNGVTDVFVRDRIPVARLMPSALDFGPVERGDRSGTATVQLDNVGVGALRVDGVGIQGAAANDFVVEAEDCTGLVLRAEPGRTCTITLSFQPGATGQRRAELVVAHEAAPGRRSVVPLQGTGVLPPFSVAPDEVDFGAVGLGLSAERTVAVVNLATLPQPVGRLSVSGGAAGEFAIVAETCPASLPRDGSCRVTLRFSPSRPGQRDGALSGTVALQPFGVALRGVGAPGQLVAGPDPVDFGTVPVAAIAERTVTVSNTGRGLLRISRVVLDGAGDLAVAGEDCPGPDDVLGPGASCAVTLRLTATEPGDKRGTLTVEAALTGLDDPAVAAVTLTGTTPPSAATIFPNPVDFGSIDVGTPATATVTVANDGPGLLTLGPPRVDGPHAADFVLSGDGCSARALRPGGSCTVDLVFTPAEAGDRSATLAVPNAGFVELLGRGLLFHPVVTLSLSLGRPGTVTFAEGTAFRPNAVVRLRWVAADDRADTPAPLTTVTEVVTDSEGRFSATPVMVFPHDHLGPRTLEARGDLRGTFATASFLVLPGTAQPAGHDVFFIQKTQLLNRG